MEKYFGTFEVDLSKDENIEAYGAKQGLPAKALEAMKAPGITRSFGANPDGTYFSEVNHPMHKRKHDFKLNEPFESDTPMGKIMVTFFMDGANLNEKVMDMAKNKEGVMKLTIEGGNLVVRMECDGICAKRVFNKK